MIREMRREEIPECVRVIRQSHRTVADQFGFTPENAPRYVAFATDERRLFWHMEYEHRLMFVDEEDGVIRGYYSLLLKPDGECELGNLSVLPEYRHRGIGTLVVRECEQWAAEMGFDRAVVESRDNKIDFYRQMGYVVSGEAKDGDTFRCIRMDRVL